MNQPDLPVRDLPRSVEYEPVEGDGVPWMVEDWPALVAAFDLEESDLVAWHTDLSGTGRAWLVIRRIFAVKPMFGDAVEDDDMEEWDWKKLSTKLGVKEAELRDDIVRAADYWRKNRTARKIGDAVKPLDADSLAPLREKMADEKITELLVQYRFDHLKGEDREMAARRIVELNSLFIDKNKREQARQLVIMELHLHDSEKTRSALKVRLDKLHGRDDLSQSESKELMAIQEAMEKQEKAHTALQKNYRDFSNDLGAEEVEQGELRKAALGTASYFVAAIQDYYADGSRALIDGVFAPDELVWLTDPIPMRPAQYRPDIVVAVNEAMKPYNFFDPEFVPSKIPREASRRMLNLARGFDETEPPAVPEIDSVPSDSDDVEAEIDDSPLPEEAPPDEAPPPPPESPVSDGSDFMAM